MLALENRNRDVTLTTNLIEPKRQSGHVKVKVLYASVNPTDFDVINGKYDLFLRLSGVKGTVRTGLEFAGIALEDSTHFKAGDRLYGYTHLLKGPKTHQGIVSMPEDYVARIPDAIDFADAATLPIASLTSLAALQDIGNMQRGQKLLLVGASGGVGLIGVQIARNMGLHVTAVAGPGQDEKLQKLGADQAINYRQQKVTGLNTRFDAIFDLSNTYSFKDIRHLLTQNGRFIPCDPLKNLGDIIRNPIRRQKTGYLFVDRGNREKLTQVSAMVANGDLVASPGKIFDLEDYDQAFKMSQQSGNKGRIVLKFPDAE